MTEESKGEQSPDGLILAVSIGLMLVVVALALLVPYFKIDWAAGDIQDDLDQLCAGKSGDYRDGFSDGVEYLRWYLNHPDNTTAAVPT